jgi:hypothetical protein
MKSKINRKKVKAARRKRPEYVTLAPGESCKMPRPECGINVERLFPVRAKDGSILPVQPKRMAKVLREQYILSRSTFPVGSKYPKSETAGSEVARASTSREEVPAS